MNTPKLRVAERCATLAGDFLDSGDPDMARILLGHAAGFLAAVDRGNTSPIAIDNAANRIGLVAARFTVPDEAIIAAADDAPVRFDNPGPVVDLGLGDGG